MAFECLIYERKDATCYLTFNRPDKLNALNAQLFVELRVALEIIELDPKIRVVILTGAGRAFSAGFDLDRGSGGAPPQGAQVQPRRADHPDGPGRRLVGAAPRRSAVALTTALRQPPEMRRGPVAAGPLRVHKNLV